MEAEAIAHSLGGAPLMVRIKPLSQSEAGNKADGGFECVPLWKVPLPDDVIENIHSDCESARRAAAVLKRWQQGGVREAAAYLLNRDYGFVSVGARASS